MPLYEYLCDSCGTQFERIQKFSDPPVTVCPNCGQPVRKLISSPAIQFKGSGWYVNDYSKSGSPEKTTGSSEKAKAEASEKSEKSDKSDKTDKSDKSDKSEKAATPAASDKAEKPAESTAKVATPAKSTGGGSGAS